MSARKRQARGEAMDNLRFMTLRSFAEAMARLGIHTAGDLLATGKALRAVRHA
jgi:hypothetical protein